MEKCVFTVAGVHRPLGIHAFEPNELPLTLPPQLNTKKFNFQLGNGKKTSDPEEAAQFFIDREYPELSKKETNEPIFIPESFLSSIPEVLHHEYTAEDTFNPKKLDKKYKTEGKLAGDFSESLIYRQLDALFLGQDCQTFRDIVVIHGWKNKWLKVIKNDDDTSEVKKQEEIESDFLVICQHQKIIVSIECKSELSKPTSGKVLNQLNRTFDVLTKTLSFGANWKFVKASAFLNINFKKFDICSHCLKFTVYQNQEVAAVWSNILQSCPELTDSSRVEFVEHVKRLTFIMHANFEKEPITREIARKKLIENINIASSKNNIIMWTKKQYSTFYTNKKIVLLTSPFGTGKTILLRAKALELAKAEQDRVAAILSEAKMTSNVIVDLHPTDVYFIILVPHRRVKKEDLFAYEDTVEFFNANNVKNVKIMTWEDILQEIKQDQGSCPQSNYDIFKDFIKKHRDSPGIFIDEYSVRLLHEDNLFICYTGKTLSFLKDQWPRVLAFALTYPEIIKRIFDLVSHMARRKKDFLQLELPHLISDDPSLQQLTVDIMMALERNDNIFQFLPCIHKFKDASLSKENAQLIHDKLEDAEVGNNLREMLLYDPSMQDAVRSFHQFRDELLAASPIGPKTTAEIFAPLTDLTENHFWVAVNKDDHMFKKLKVDDLSGFKDLDNYFEPPLVHNLRNVQEVAKFFYGNYANCTNMVKGRRPKHIQLRISSDKNKAAELFEAFLEGLQYINDTDDLLVASSDAFGPAFHTLLDMIVDHLEEKGVPVCVVRGAAVAVSNKYNTARAGDFIRRGRKGVVLADPSVVQGCEFKSVIAFFPIREGKKRWHYESTHYISIQNIMLRAMCNLVVIDFEQSSSKQDPTQMAEIELD